MSKSEALVVVTDLRKRVKELNTLRLDLLQKIKHRVSFPSETCGTIELGVYVKEHGEEKPYHCLPGVLSSVQATTPNGKVDVTAVQKITLQDVKEVEYSVTIDSLIESKKPKAILTRSCELVVVPSFYFSSQPLPGVHYQPLRYVPTNSSQSDVKSIMSSYYSKPPSGKQVSPPTAAVYSVTSTPQLGASQEPVAVGTSTLDESTPPPKRQRDQTTAEHLVASAPLSKKQKHKHSSPTTPASPSLSEPVDNTERPTLLEQFDDLVEAPNTYRPDISIHLDDDVLI